MSLDSPTPLPALAAIARVEKRHGPDVESSVRFAGDVAAALATSPRVKVSFVGVRGVSSAYFNAFLNELALRCPVGSVPDRIEPEFDSDAQRFLFEKSVGAFINRSRLQA
ncbi:MAG: hypothetical protein K2X32_02840 [Phycisphaerales bacterium]|nr:hypothetical protein [Phycisphaerales bacterium]